MNILKGGNLSMEGEIVVKNAVKREEGYLYFVDKNGNICRSKMKRTGRAKSNKKIKKSKKK